MTTTHWLSLLFVIGFMIVHFSSKYLDLNPSNPRSPWLSGAAGATMGYAFLFLLPELSKYLEVLKNAASGSWLSFFAEYSYLLALLGLMIYYGLDVTAKAKKNSAFGSVFWVHTFFFFFYNMAIGYLIVHTDFANQWERALYFLALAAHFGAADYTLKELLSKRYDKYGRWILVIGIFAGWVASVTLHLSEVTVGITVSLLAGAILFNTFKDELREGKLKNYVAFLAGSMAIALLFMAVKLI